MNYDPNIQPDPDAWLGSDEDERISAVLAFHGDSLGDPERDRLHAYFHTLAENQVALGDETPAAAAVKRLMREGLERHDAIHALASVNSEMLYDMQGSGELYSEKDFKNRLKRLTAKRWLRGGG